MPSIIGNVKDNAYGAPNATGALYLTQDFLYDIMFDGYYVRPTDAVCRRTSDNRLGTRIGSRQSN